MTEVTSCHAAAALVWLVGLISLFGVVGKFIYISQDELESVANFIKKRGRVSITEIVSESNRLIRLS